jgi:hypothetical protein
MDPDLILTVGLLLGVLGVPALVSALTDARAPRLAALLLVGAAACIVSALMMKPGGYAINDLPAVVMGAIGRLL